jgi:transposase
VLDVSTLVRSVRELEANGIKTKLAVLDAGYYSDENIRNLYDMKIDFVTRMKENLKLYKDLIAMNAAKIESKENLIEYNGRYIYLKCVECQVIQGCKAFAYVGLDIDRKANESKKLFAKANAKKLTPGEVHDRISHQGFFIIVSSKRFKTDEILPMYYTRQQIEQVFDIGKNYANITPLRVQNENTFRGHLLLTFIATIIIKKLQDILKNTSYNPISLFINMRNQKCKVFADRIITQEAFKKANDCYKLFNIKCPVEISKQQEN